MSRLIGQINPNRVRALNAISVKTGPVIYWMQRDQRASDNWAMLYGQALAQELKQPFAVVFNIVPKFLDASWRQYDFMIQGLKELENTLSKKQIPLFVLTGEPVENLTKFVRKNNVGALVTDFNPLRMPLGWQAGLAKKLDIAVRQVDTHNIVPAWVVSPKQEFAAYTIRPKIHKLLLEYLTEFPKLTTSKYSWTKEKPNHSWSKIIQGLQVDKSAGSVSWLKPGEKSAQKALNNFLQNKLARYDELRNDPTYDAQSNLSPYFHFGQLSPQRAALVASRLPPSSSRESFLEELIVRRELSDNFCFYNSNYDNTKGFPEWAVRSLTLHQDDERQYIYSLTEFEQAKTHDVLWNAAQLEMVLQGKMHGYMRMYWAKKILEWTPDFATAMKYAVYLNDKYELDGRDPNGYVGCAWSIGGLHDRAWGERSIFGKIRYMSYNGAKSKFKVQGYIDKINALNRQTLL